MQASRILISFVVTCKNAPGFQLHNELRRRRIGEPVLPGELHAFSVPSGTGTVQYGTPQCSKSLCSI